MTHTHRSSTGKRSRVHRRVITFAVSLCIAFVTVFVILPAQRIAPALVERSAVITNAGVYEIGASGARLHIEVVDGIVQYRATGAQGEELFQSDEQPSTYQRWGFAVGQDESVWFWSSDIGGAVWNPAPGGYVRRSLSDPGGAAAPPEFLDFLPQSIRKELVRP